MLCVEIGKTIQPTVSAKYLPLLGVAARFGFPKHSPLLEKYVKASQCVQERRWWDFCVDPDISLVEAF